MSPPPLTEEKTIYGHEVIIDLHDADVSMFNRDDLGAFLDTMCEILDVEVCDRHYWDDVGVRPEERQTDPKCVGTTVVQFLLFSNITVHTLDLLKTAYVNIFVCREFDIQAAVDYCGEFFAATLKKVTILERE